ncbi:MAG: alpha-amylase family protein [Bryobacteraceae bacterium]
MHRRDFLCSSLSAGLATGLAFAAPDTVNEDAIPELPFRQVHLDFHTSELIPDVGADFNAREFAAMLKSARVNSINIFAKDHHGYAYYDTKIATRHPALQIDLLGEMIEALHASGIRVNYYYSLVWDVLQSRRHPEWRAVERDGSLIGGPPADAWPWMCMNTPYLDHVVRENREIAANYPADGAWFDILKQPPAGCFCKWCAADRRQLGLGDTGGDIFKHNKIVATRVEQRLFGVVRGQNPKAAIFFNSRIVVGVRDELKYYSHIEIESLPPGGWGYSHFEQRVRYVRTLGKDFVGMTGRFHKSWGDFGGLKNQAALDFECLNFLANGAKACIGDQLHPRGRLDQVTYARIGKTYAKIEALEPWARGTRAVADIGAISAAATDPDMTTQKLPVADRGFTNMLLELHHQFDVLDLNSDFGLYKVLIVPDEIHPSPALTKKLEAFLARGGSLIVSHRSLLGADSRFTLSKNSRKTESGAKHFPDGAGMRAGAFALPALGIEYLGPAKYNGEYMLLKPGAFPGVDDTAYYLYQPGSSIAAKPGTEVLATYGHPYFDRSPEHFSSHHQTPLGRRTDEPLITRNGNVVYIANPFFTSYAKDAYGIQKELVGRLIASLLPQPSIVAPGLPSTAHVTVLEQPRESGNRRIVHVLYFPLTRRAPDIDMIEEPGLLENVKLQVRLPQHPMGVQLIPRRDALPWRYDGAYCSVEIPKVVGHQAVLFE